MNRNITELIERLNSIPFSLLDVFKEKFVEMLEKENMSSDKIKDLAPLELYTLIVFYLYRNKFENIEFKLELARKLAKLTNRYKANIIFPSILSLFEKGILKFGNPKIEISDKNIEDILDNVKNKLNDIINETLKTIRSSIWLSLEASLAARP